MRRCRFQSHSDRPVRTGFDMTNSSPRLTAHVKSKLLTGLEVTALRHILDAAQVRHMPPKTDLIVAEGPPNNLFLLRAGRTGFYHLSDSGTEVLLLWKQSFSGALGWCPQVQVQTIFAGGGDLRLRHSSAHKHDQT